MERLDIKKLVTTENGLFVSIYIPTDRTNQGNQDLTRFKNMVKKAENLLKERGEKSEAYLEGAYDLIGDLKFWVNNLDGLGFIATNEFSEVSQLYGTTNEIVSVSEYPHILPLVNYYELPNDYYLLDLSRDRFEIYETSVDKIDVIDLPNVEKKFHDLFDDKDRDDHKVNHTRGSQSGVHSHLTKSQSDEMETDKWFRYIAKELRNVINENPLPVVLFGTTENVHLFKDKAESLNIKGMIEKPMNSYANNREIVAAMKETLLPEFIDNMDKDLEDLESNIANEKGSVNPDVIVVQARLGRVAKLFVNKDFEIDADKLDEVITEVLRTDGEVILVDSSKNEFEGDVKAQYRY